MAQPVLLTKFVGRIRFGWIWIFSIPFSHKISLVKFPSWCRLWLGWLCILRLQQSHIFSVKKTKNENFNILFYSDFRPKPKETEAIIESVLDDDEDDQQVDGAASSESGVKKMKINGAECHSTGPPPVTLTIGDEEDAKIKKVRKAEG